MQLKKVSIFFLILPALASSLFLVSCEKEITVDLPTASPKIVVEGNILPGQPPLIMLTWSQGYFEPTDLSTLQNLFVHDAIATISVDGESHALAEICTSDLTPEQLEIAAQAIGISPESLQALNLCIYSSLDLFGAEGKVYTLQIDYQDHHLRGTTRIPEIVHLNDLYFDVLSTLPNDSLGFIYGNITDPDTLGNAYRWFAKRINHYHMDAEDEELRGQQKDFGYIAPLGSVFDDAFFNGLTFEFAYYRGAEANSNKFDDHGIERGFFKRGDTVAVRGCTIDRNAFRFIDSFENQLANQGSPFAVPFNVESNMSGGLGAFIGYGAVYDTVICN